MYINLSVDDLLARNREKIDRIRFASTGTFDDTHMPLIRQVGKWFNSLPISKDLWEEPGGGFRCAVETTLFCVEQSRNAIFTAHLSSDLRKVQEPLYRYAAFVAGMLSWMEEPYRNFTVIHGGMEFNPIVMPLTDALESDPHFEIKNRVQIDPPSRQMTLMYASGVLKLGFEHIPNPEIRKALADAINPPRMRQGLESPLQATVRKGLLQAEECERTAKGLIFKSVDREVTPVQFIDEIIANTNPNKAGSNDEDGKVPDKQTAHSQQPAQTANAHAEAGNKPVQGSLDIGGHELAKLPAPLRELLGALAADIRSNDKDRSKIIKMTTGNYTMPMKFFVGYGRDINRVAEDLRELKLVIGGDKTHVLIVEQLGKLLLGET